MLSETIWQAGPGWEEGGYREKDKKEEKEEWSEAKKGRWRVTSVQVGDNRFIFGINSLCLQTISQSFTCNITCVSPINTPRYIMVELA